MVDTMVGDSPDMLVLPMNSKSRICSSFDRCSISFQECFSSMVGLWLPLYEFEVVVLKHLKVSPSYIHQGSMGFHEGVIVLRWAHVLEAFSPTILGLVLHRVYTPKRIFITRGLLNITWIMLGSTPSPMTREISLGTSY